MSDTPVWDKPRPKGLGKSHKLSSSQKAKAKAAAKAAGRPWPNLVDNMRAARAFGGMAYEQQNIAQGLGVPVTNAPMGNSLAPPMNQQQSGQINYNPNNIPPVMPSPSLPPPQPVQAPVQGPSVMSDNVPRTMADGGAVEDALRLAKTSPILNNHTGDRLPMRPYGPRFNPQSGELDSRDLKDIGYYGPIRDPEGYSVTEYSGNRGNFTYPTVHKGMSDEDLAATLMHEHLNKPKYEGDDIISNHLNAAEPKIPFPEDVDQRAYEVALERLSEGHSPYFEQGKDEYPAWSPEQHWEEPEQRADGGGVEDNTSVDQPDYEKASQFEQQQLQSGESQLPQTNREMEEATEKWGNRALGMGKAAAYLHPTTRAAMGAYDLIHGLGSGNPNEVAQSIFAAPGKVAKAIGAAALSQQPESENANPRTRFLRSAYGSYADGGVIDNALRLTADDTDAKPYGKRKKAKK